ncbi:MAG: thioredoxin domain-containing protein, partial [Thermoanaerobaculia bacterium]|nr:thioredoxin domain-containing protein [Thermoanaerobaculia bacterium]
NVKVDREERPDLDEIYMAATQILTGHGGWPNSVFLTPDLEPFFAGTYFPPETRGGMPGFPAVLASLSDAWRNRRGDVREQAAGVARALERYLEEREAGAGELPSPELALRSLADLERRFDREHGGFGGAPKFPTPSNLYLLDELADERPQAAEMLAVTLDRMARGGIYDQLGGGFHRYATDDRWLVPHFEKMLYDNGFLVELTARQAARAGDPEMARVAREIAAWLAREMTSPEGAFWSAQDAETDGEEGAFYVWRRPELAAELDEEALGLLAPIYGFDGPPFFEGDRYVLHLPRPLAEQARRRRMSLPELHAELRPLLERLLVARRRRPPLLVDDKILADWNGIAIAGLAVAGRLLDEPEMVAQAGAAADFVLSEMRPAGGTLLHAWRAGRGKIPAFLADYAHLIRGCLELHRATGDDGRLAAACALADEMHERLEDPEGGYWSAAAAPDLLVRSKEIFDGATPGANAMATLCLLGLAELDGEPRWRRRAERTLAYFAPLAARHPEAARMMTLAARRAAAPEASPAVSQPPVEVAAAVGDPDPQGWRRLEIALAIADGWHLAAPGAEELAGQPPRLAAEDLELDAVRLPEGRPLALAPDADPVPCYVGRVVIEARVRPAGACPRLLLTYQPCDDRRCLAPVERVVPVG